VITQKAMRALRTKVAKYQVVERTRFARFGMYDHRWGMLVAHLEVAEVSELAEARLTERAHHAAYSSISVPRRSESVYCGCVMMCLSPCKLVRRVCIVILRACKRCLAVVNPVYAAREVVITENPHVVKPCLCVASV
jgi:hypothetical protein